MRPPELNIKRARGFLLIVAIVLLVVVALAVAALGNMTSADIRAGSGHAQSDQAYFAATSGVEYAANQYFNGSACAGINASGAAVGSASFSLTPTLYVPTNAPTNALTATTAALTTSSTAVAVGSTTGYAPNGRILIDAELIDYTSTTATSFNGISRGAGGTVAATHATGATVSQNLCGIVSAGSASGGVAVRELNAVIGSGTMANAGALGTMGPDAMVAYAKGTALTGAGSDSNVYFRLWDSSINNWSATEQTAQPVSATPTFIAVQFARTRNEAIMGVIDGNNNFYLQVWNGRTWTMLNGGAALATTSANTSRNFQIAYEYANDRALIVYQNGSSNPQYAIWNGTTLTLAGMILSPAGTYPVAGTTARHLWFRLAPRNVAGSNDILMMSTDSNQDVFGLRWTGAAWSNMGTATRWDTSTSNTNNREAIDVTWQSDGSKAVFVYGDAANQAIRYRTWTAASSTLGALVASTALTTPAGYTAARYEWVRLYPGPSDNILLMLQTANAGTNPSLESVTWNSGTSAFNTATTGHDNGNAAATGVENAVSRGFDFAWENLPSASGSGWLVWGSRAGGIRSRYFTVPATWGAVSATFRGPDTAGSGRHALALRQIHGWCLSVQRVRKRRHRIADDDRWRNGVAECGNHTLGGSHHQPAAV